MTLVCINMRTDKWVINKEDAAVNKMYWSLDSICQMDLNGQEVDSMIDMWWDD